MPRPEPTVRLPSYRRHKPSGQAVVTLSGREIYLGRYGTKQSKPEYQRVVGEWLAAGGSLPSRADLTIAELCLAYWRWAKGQQSLAGIMNAESFGLAADSVRASSSPLRTTRILDAFEECGWPSRIDDPIPPRRDSDQRQRLADAVRLLNSNGVIRFELDGNGLGVVWKATQQEPEDDSIPF
jgi:hypothetical protein